MATCDQHTVIERVRGHTLKALPRTKEGLVQLIGTRRPEKFRINALPGKPESGRHHEEEPPGDESIFICGFQAAG